ncbi:CopD family protein [Massilia sp.]|uniref:CopD family protein n=1 Tax=Massilia sp. TaxID=1882437 RepID=UPI0039170E3B
MLYLCIKALHVSAAITWISGQLLLILSTAFAQHASISNAGETRTAYLNLVNWWDQRVTSPAMMVTWALGLYLALNGGWFPQAWLLVKMALVVGLSTGHGIMRGRLRKLCWESEVILSHAPSIAASTMLLGGIVLAVAILVCVKPM